ncbi:MAG: hypothetical protein AAFN42_11435 [Cyanobacteria bacterium J06554_1]
MKFAPWSAIPAVCMALISARPGVAQSLTEQANRVRQINSQRPTADIPTVATDATPSAEAFTIPSLWWQEQQQGEAINGRLIDSWRAYDATVSPTSYVDVIVNGQIWPVLSYLEQYAFITQFGESAKSYGYQLRVFTGERLVGLHVCDFTSAINQPTDNASDSMTALPAIPNCIVDLDYFGQGAIRGGGRR